MDNAPLLTTKEVADRLRVSAEMVRVMCRAGKPHIRVGRFYRFAEGQYHQIIEPPPIPAPRPRNQRQRIRQLLDSMPPGKLDAVVEKLPNGS